MGDANKLDTIDAVLKALEPPQSPGGRRFEEEEDLVEVGLADPAAAARLRRRTPRRRRSRKTINERQLTADNAPTWTITHTLRAIRDPRRTRPRADRLTLRR